MIEKKETVSPETESCQWKWVVLQEVSGWACENHISLLRTPKGKKKKKLPSLSAPFLKRTRSQANFEHYTPFDTLKKKKEASEHETHQSSSARQKVATE